MSQKIKTWSKWYSKGRYSLVKLSFFLAIIWLLIQQIEKTPLNWNQLTFSWTTFSVFLAGVAGLIGLNYLLEIAKWHRLVLGVRYQNRRQSMAQVLRGFQWGSFSPLMIGDFAGRAYGFAKDDRPQILLLNGFNSATQTYLAFAFGIVALGLKPSLFGGLSAFFGLGLFLTILGVGILFFYEKLTSIFFKKHTFRISLKDKSYVLSLTFFRNSLYVLQFIWILRAFNLSLPWDVAFSGASSLFFLKTFGGMFNIFGDLALRESFVLHFFAGQGLAYENLLMAMMVLWLANVFFPLLFVTLFLKE